MHRNPKAIQKDREDRERALKEKAAKERMPKGFPKPGKPKPKGNRYIKSARTEQNNGDRRAANTQAKTALREDVDEIVGKPRRSLNI